MCERKVKREGMSVYVLSFSLTCILPLYFSHTRTLSVRDRGGLCVYDSEKERDKSVSVCVCVRQCVSE